MAQPLESPYSYFADANGAPLAGGFVYTYAAGTTTPQNSYTDSTGITPAANPVVLDSAGRATIWLSGSYKIVVKDSLGNTIVTTDNITSTGDMTKAVYDAANVAEQVVGLTATQTFTNKSTSTLPSSGLSANSVANMAAVVNSMVGGCINKFRNGTFDVWQRGTSGTITAGSPAYAADGFIVSSTGANITWARASANNFGCSYYLALTGATSVSDSYVKQRIESLLAQQLFSNSSTAVNVTFQCAIYNNTGASITPTITVKHATLQDNWGATVTDVNGVNLQACPAANTTVCAYTFMPSGNSINGLEITIDFGSVLNSGAKVIGTFAWDIRATPGTTTGLNSTPPILELRHVQTELALSQRYFQQLGGTANYMLGNTHNTTTTAFEAIVPLRTTMRTAPSASVSAAGMCKISSGASGALTTTALTPGNISSDTIYIAGTVASGLTAGNGGILYIASSSDYLRLSAEL